MYFYLLSIKTMQINVKILLQAIYLNTNKEIVKTSRCVTFQLVVCACDNHDKIKFPKLKLCNLKDYCKYNVNNIRERQICELDKWTLPKEIMSDRPPRDDMKQTICCNIMCLISFKNVNQQPNKSKRVIVSS